MDFPLRVLVEGLSDEIVARRILEYVGINQYIIQAPGGKSKIITAQDSDPRSKLEKCNQAAQFMPWFVLLDLDDEHCPVTYVNTLLPTPSQYMSLRIAVRETEAWLLADREQIAGFIGVPVNNVTMEPDAPPVSE